MMVDENVEDIDPELETLRKQAEDLLSGKDSIMEPRITEAIDRLIHMFNWSPEQVVLRLVNNYTGYAQLVHIVNDWLALAMRLEAKSSLSDLHDIPATRSASHHSHLVPSAENSSSDCPPNEQIVMNLLSQLIKQKFDKTAVDRVLDTGSEVPPWLLEMMYDSTWRRLLVELYDQHRGSALMGYCLRKISSLGFHSDIAELIGEADYFTVFNELLIDLLREVVSTDESGLNTLNKNLRRLCCASEYTFLYSLALLRATEDSLRTPGGPRKRPIEQSTGCDVDESSIEPVGLEEGREDETGVEGREGTGGMVSHEINTKRDKSRRLASRKIRRLRQELENTQVWGRGSDTGSTSSGGGGGSVKGLDALSFFSLKLLDVSVPTAVRGGVGSEPDGTAEVRRELLDMLKRGSVDAVHLQRLVAQYFPKAWESKTSSDVPLVVTVKDLSRVASGLSPSLDLLRRSQVLSLLADSLLHPQRALPDTNVHSALLLALASVVPHPQGEGEGEGSQVPMIGVDERVTALMDKLLRTRSLCREMSLPAFGVAPVLDVPEELVQLMKGQPVVSMCILLRLLSLVRHPDFASSTSYSNVLPLYLYVVCEACDGHPLQRHDCFLIMKEVLLRTPDTAEVVESARIISNRKDALDTFLHILGSGYVTEPMAFLTTLLPSLDATLVRHLVHGLLTVAKPPFSKEFALKITDFMVHRSVREAVSRHFSDSTILHDFASYILSDWVQCLSPSLVLELRALQNIRAS